MLKTSVGQAHYARKYWHASSPHLNGSLAISPPHVIRTTVNKYCASTGDKYQSTGKTDRSVKLHGQIPFKSTRYMSFKTSSHQGEF